MSLSLFCVHSFIFTFGACQPFKARCIKCVSIMSLWFLNGGPRSFQGCIKGVSRVLQDVSPVFQGFFQELQGCFKGASRQYYRCFDDISRVLQECCLKGVSRVSPGCLEDVLRVFKCCFKIVSRVFRRFLKGVSRAFPRMSSIIFSVERS